jgi:hypothetical protein
VAVAILGIMAILLNMKAPSVPRPPRRRPDDLAATQRKKILASGEKIKLKPGSLVNVIGRGARIFLLVLVVGGSIALSAFISAKLIDGNAASIEVPSPVVQSLPSGDSDSSESRDLAEQPSNSENPAPEATRPERQEPRHRETSGPISGGDIGRCKYYLEQLANDPRGLQYNNDGMFGDVEATGILDITATNGFGGRVRQRVNCHEILRQFDN